MARPKDLDAVVETAVLAASGLSQAAIAAQLDIDAATVTRRYQSAVRYGYLSIPEPIPPTLNRNAIPEEVLMRVQNRITSAPLRAELLDRFRSVRHQGFPLLREITIVQSSSSRTDRTAWSQRIRCLAPAAVHRIYSLLPKMRLVGVAWGENLRAVADRVGCDAQNGTAPKARNAEFIPVGCEPMFVSYPIQMTASEIAKDLCAVLGKRGFVPPNLAPAPAFIPKSLAHRRATLRAFVSSIPDYKKVFGDPKKKFRTGRVAKLDTIITSAGGAAGEFHGSPWFRARLKAEKLSEEEWAKSIAGDMAGVVFARADLTGARSAEARRMAADINSRNFGLVQDDFVRCACNSATSGGSRPGVIVLAHGNVKARVVLAAIYEKCVNELVIDSELANSLKQISR